MSRPLKRIVPALGCRNLVSRLKQVVLPAPFGPISAWIVPRRTSRSTSLTATKPPKRLVSAAAERMMSLVRAHLAVQPPSIEMAEPVIERAMSPQR